MNLTALDTTDPDRRWARMAGLEQRWRVVALLPRQPAVDVVIPVHLELLVRAERAGFRIHVSPGTA